MAIPTPEDCRLLMERYRMPEHIRAHSLLVGRVAEALAAALLARGEPIRVELALAGGLLHDIAKALCLEDDCNHARMGREICRRHGYDEVGPLVAEHVLLSSGGNGRCNEREIVYYADKRVCHASIVTLDERRDDIIRRYAPRDARRQEQIRHNFQICKRLEERLFGGLSLTPSDLAQLATIAEEI
ncbi:MAG TPA: HDIG domain-containing protein [Desulfurivibrio alkaliphilus]|uniref:HDIG domain-containing protein n=1 Tax=Desulfurivibrio alkaliphilus TaxID=427923 RepID=A0A7C2TFB6_9BACT|nr:HDIG domain-containing protein [Desulfurivibrio alkaliphilus]